MGEWGRARVGDERSAVPDGFCMIAYCYQSFLTGKVSPSGPTALKWPSGWWQLVHSFQGTYFPRCQVFWDREGRCVCRQCHLTRAIYLYSPTPGPCHWPCSTCARPLLFPSFLKTNVRDAMLKDERRRLASVPPRGSSPAVVFAGTRALISISLTFCLSLVPRSL